jgi:hypothetical protein
MDVSLTTTRMNMDGFPVGRLQDEARSWNKLECLVRFRMPERIDVIEDAAKLARCEVEWSPIEDHEGFAVVDLVRSI